MDDVSYLPAVWYSGSTQTSVRWLCSTRWAALGPWSCSSSNVTVREYSWFNLAHYISKFYIFVMLIYPTYYTLVCIRCCSHVVLWIILAFPERWFSYVRNAYGSTSHCRHCTLGCIAYSRLLRRSSLLRPLSRVPVMQSRKPSSLHGPRSFRHLQLRYFTEKEICGVWYIVWMHWTVWNGRFMALCCSGCGLGLP